MSRLVFYVTACDYYKHTREKKKAKMDGGSSYGSDSSIILKEGATFNKDTIVYPIANEQQGERREDLEFEELLTRVSNIEKNQRMVIFSKLSFNVTYNK